MCGKEFEKKSNCQKYCSKECCHRDMDAEYRRRGKEKKKIASMRRNVSIVDIDAEARSVGMTYGKYVAKYGL
jgi:ribosomal protein L20